MSMRNNPIARLLRYLWRGIDGFRKVLHLLLLLMIFSIVVAGLAGQGVRVPASAALVVAPSGVLVEQLEGDALERALAELQGDGEQQTLVRDIIDSLEAAATDDRIKAVVLSLDDLKGGGLSKLQITARAINNIREAGKPVLALGDSFTQVQYYLAAQADQVYMHELGEVYIDGYGYYRAFFKSALDKLSVDLNVFRVGEFKSFVEPFTRDDMSEEDKAASQRWLDALWHSYQADVVAARGMAPGSLDDYANNMVARLDAAGGNAARAAVAAGLVDELVSRQQFRDRVRQLVGESKRQPGTYSSIDFRSYLSSIRRTDVLTRKENNIGVIVAAGQIIDGEAPPGTIGGDSLAGLVSRAAADDSVDAVVLRVDSPGGSMFASEVVFDQLQELKAGGKPLIVSMSSVAASGGYYIGMLADEIWASGSTITGSIGVGALIPTFQRGLDRLGIHVDGIGTTDLSGQLRVDRELGEDARQLAQKTVEEAYRIFLGKVAEARSMSIERADSVARGRVWIGTDALDLGLVDALGGLDEAVAAAAARLGLTEGEYGIKYVEKELSLQERLALELAVRARTFADRFGLSPQRGSANLLRNLAAAVERGIGEFTRLNDPRGLYSLCFCEVP